MEIKANGGSAKKSCTAGGVMSAVVRFIRKNTIMCVALAAAAITSFIVPIDKEYLAYFDFKTLTCLFCVLAVAETVFVM